MTQSDPSHEPMTIGMVGLGRMGGGMARRLAEHGHTVHVHDRDAAVTAGLADQHERLLASSSIAELVADLPAPAIVWIMVPSGDATDAAIGEAAPLLGAGDVLINGGNCRWTDSARYAELAGEASYLDVGVSGGIWGHDHGYCLMVGGDAATYAQVEPVLASLAVEDGLDHVGGVGAGHYVKMVHNGIEYGLMQAYTEGFHLLRDSGLDLDLDRIAKVWQHGSVVRSWLLELISDVLEEEGDLAHVAPLVPDSGEGRWAAEAAIEAGVPVPVLAASLFSRMSTQQDGYSDRILAALRARFGGHEVARTIDAPSTAPADAGEGA